MRRTGAKTDSIQKYAALLRGVSPLNARMSELKAAFGAAGFVDVKTVLSSGNVLFGAPAGKAESLARQCETAMTAHLGRAFWTVVVPVAELRALVAADPWRAFKVPPAAKRVVSFLRETPTKLPRFPVEKEGATIFALDDRIVFSAYLAHPKGPVFMTLIQKTFGENVTTRTWDTVKRLAG
ncbi:MAG: DUF1697 domain-containing protein [Polyangia bacterium]